MRNQSYIQPCISSKWISRVCAVAVAITLIACEDVFEEDLEDSRVTLIAPMDSLVSENYTQLFKWNEVEDAIDYQLQIVRPRFDSIEEFVLDSAVTSTLFNFTLFPGTFQWRVRARNGSSETPYVTRNLRIDSTVNLNGVTPTLRSPIDNLVTNQTSPTFNWDPVVNASSYIFRIVRGTDFENGERHEPDRIILGPMHNLSTALTEGTYTWGTQAENDFSKSRFATRTIQVDLTPPLIPVLTSPTNNQQFISGSSLSFSWQASTENVSDSIVLAQDASLSQVVWKVASDSASYVTDVNSGTYYWAVTRRDPAGNGSIATTRSFSVQ